MNNPDSNIEITCPCCAARLTIDRGLGRVVAHEAPPKQARKGDPDRLERAAHLLEEQAEMREAHFRESAQAESIKSDLLERKFEEALKKTRNQPVKPTLRDIDLD